MRSSDCSSAGAVLPFGVDTAHTHMLNPLPHHDCHNTQSKQKKHTHTHTHTDTHRHTHTHTHRQRD